MELHPNRLKFDTQKKQVTLGFYIFPQGVIRRSGLTMACDKAYRASMVPEQQDESYCTAFIGLSLYC
jgi:hypothetical protein